MAKYRITSLPGYNKRLPLSKAQFGGLNKFLEGGGPCPPDKEIYPQFSQFGCISSSQYNKLIEQTKGNLEKQKLYKETKLADQKILHKARTDGDRELSEKLLVEWKAKYPGENSSCPNDKCPEYDLVLEPDPVIPPVEIPEEIPEIPKLSLSGYPDAPLYSPTDNHMDVPTLNVRLPTGKIKRIFDRGIIDHKGHIKIGEKEVTRPIPKMVQKATGYDRNFMEGYEDEEGNYIPGEIENAEREGRQINFKGQSSLKDKKAQSKYNQEWEQYNIEKTGIKDYNLNLLKEAGISPEEYVKKYGEFKYGGLHKFVAGGPTDCDPGYYWNGKACVKDYGNPLYQNNALNKGSLIDQKIKTTEGKGMAYQATSDELKRLYAQRAQEKAKQDAIYRKAANQKKRDALAKQQLIEQEFNAQINPNKTYSETVGTVAGNAGAAQTQGALENQIGAKKEYHQKRKFVTDNYLNTNRDALINEAARSIQSSSNLTYEQALEQAKQDEALLFSLAEKHTPTDSQHLSNIADSQDFYGNKGSYQDQIKGFDPNDPEHISFEDQGTLGGYMQRAKDIALNPLDAAHYAMSNEKMPYNFGEYEKMKKLTGFTDGADDNVVMKGLDFASWFHPVGLYGQGIKMLEPTAESILKVYNDPTLENVGDAALNVGTTALTLLASKNPLKFLAEEKFAADAATGFRNWNPAQTGPTPPFNTGTGLLPVGVTTEVRAAAGATRGTTPLLNSVPVGFNPTVTMNSPYGIDRASLSRFIPEETITPSSNLYDTETDLFLNQSEPLEEYATNNNEVAADLERVAINVYNKTLADAEAAHQAWRSSGTPDAASRLNEAHSRHNIARELLQTEAPNYASQLGILSSPPPTIQPTTSVPSSISELQYVNEYEAARAEQQEAMANYYANPTSMSAVTRRERANDALAVAEENISVNVPDYISQPYIPANANLNATTAASTANINSPAATAASSFNTNSLYMNSLSATGAPFDGLAQALGTSPNKNINYSNDTIAALTRSRPNNNFFNGQTVSQQLSGIDDPVDYANRLRELYSEGVISRTSYDELSTGLTAHIENTPNSTMRSDAALDIIGVDPDVLYTGSKLSEVAAEKWINNIPSYQMDDALGYYGYSRDEVAQFFSDPNLSDDVRRIAYNQIKDDYKYMADFNIRNPNARPIDFSTGQITSPALKKTNTISDYKTLKISKESKDILDKTMYKDLDLSTGSVSFVDTETKHVYNIIDKKNLVATKDLDKQLAAYEEAYNVVKEKGGFAEKLIRNKLEDLKGTKYLRTTYADQMRAAGKDPSEIMECSIISQENGSKSLLDKDGVVLGTVNFYQGQFNGKPYSEVSSTGLKIKYHGHSLKHSAVKTWDKAQEVLTKRYLQEALESVEKANRKNPIVVKGLTKQAEIKAANQIKQLQINNNNKFGEALYAGVSAALKDTRGLLATTESFMNTILPDPVTDVRISRPRAKNAWGSWGKQYYEGVPRAGYVQGPSMYPYDYHGKTENFINSPNFILRKLGGNISKLSKFTQ